MIGMELFVGFAPILACLVMATCDDDAVHQDRFAMMCTDYFCRPRVKTGVIRFLGVP